MWDMLSGGFSLDPIIAEMRAMGLPPTRPPHMEASRLEALTGLWAGAGLQNVETREITVQRTFVNFNELWEAQTKAPSTAPVVAAMVADLKQRVQARVPADAQGRITYSARANAIKGFRRA